MSRSAAAASAAMLGAGAAAAGSSRRRDAFARAGFAGLFLGASEGAFLGAATVADFNSDSVPENETI
ncbi:hypothetical protein A9975_35320 [Cupriavidus sp. UME77]|nr:hypothetical protein [Cupriavidus sp. UME77]